MRNGYTEFPRPEYERSESTCSASPQHSGNSQRPTFRYDAPVAPTRCSGVDGKRQVFFFFFFLFLEWATASEIGIVHSQRMWIHPPLSLSVCCCFFFNNDFKSEAPDTPVERSGLAVAASVRMSPFQAYDSG